MPMLAGRKQSSSAVFVPSGLLAGLTQWAKSRPSKPSWMVAVQRGREGCVRGASKGVEFTFWERRRRTETRARVEIKVKRRFGSRGRRLEEGKKALFSRAGRFWMTVQLPRRVPLFLRSPWLFRFVMCQKIPMVSRAYSIRLSPLIPLDTPNFLILVNHYFSVSSEVEGVERADALPVCDAGILIERADQGLNLVLWHGGMCRLGGLPMLLSGR